jgi:type IV pilus assembly protein PilX
MRKQLMTSPHRQRGAALAVGLILLLVLTLLAVSGMNTASTELIMAGNEQYRQRAFQAASTGVERALSTLPSAPQLRNPPPSAPAAVTGEATDTYVTTTQYMGDDLNIAGFSTGKFVGFHYLITSDGTSSRNSRSEQLQGAYVIQSAGGGGSFTSLNPGE